MLYVDLSRKLADLGYTVDRYTYECGERITVREGIHIVISLSADCDEDVSASQKIVEWFNKDGWTHASTHTG